MKFKILLLLCVISPLSIVFAQTGKTYQVKSPDGRISIDVNAGSAVNWSVKHGDSNVIMPSEISITLDNGEVLGKNPSIKKAVTSSANEIINTPIYKKDAVQNNYNQLTLTFKGDYGLIF